MNELQHFINRLWNDVNPVLAVVWSIICWVMFPQDTYMVAALAVGIGTIVDLLTKLYALSINNGGWHKATKLKIIASDTLWRKTQVKIVSYLSIMIMTGLAIRVTQVEFLANGLATFVYSVIFIREFQSVLENGIEAGSKNLIPILSRVRKKEKCLLEQEEKEL